MVKYTLACRVAFSLLYNCFYCIMHQTYKLSKLIVNMFLYFRLTGTNIFNATLNHGKPFLLLFIKDDIARVSSGSKSSCLSLHFL